MSLLIRFSVLGSRFSANTEHRTPNTETGFLSNLKLSFAKLQDLRYGENPHQKAAFYKDESCDEPSVSNSVQLHGKELSFNNIIDLNAALEIVNEFDEPAATILPCPVGTLRK